MANLPNGYTDTDISDMNNAQTFEDLVPIATRVIARIGPLIEMVCGPITSGGTKSLQRNLEILKSHIELLEYKGIKVFNQWPFEESFWRISRDENYFKGKSQLLDAFYLPIFKSGHITTLNFIPNWESSFGASWEHQQALRLNLEIVYL